MLGLLSNLYLLAPFSNPKKKRVSCFIEFFVWFHIVCDRYSSDYAHFTFSDTIHFHGSGGLILWYDLRLWLISNYISNCIKIYHRCCRFYQIISPLLAIIWNEIFEENYSSYFSLQLKCLRTNHQGNAWKIKRENI